MRSKLDEISLVSVSGSILGRAEMVDPIRLRTLDSIHFATALEVGAGEMLSRPASRGRRKCRRNRRAKPRRVRIIAGTHRGHRIAAPPGRDTRPTSDRVRENAFNLIGPVDDADVLDLFAGSGAMGLEALSRGA